MDKDEENSLDHQADTRPFKATKRSLLVILFVFFYSRKREIAIALGPVSFALILALAKVEDPPETPDGGNKVVEMLAVISWVCIWWVTEALPVAITSLVPLFLFPALEIMNANLVAQSYMNDTIILFIGSFILAIAVEKYQAHKRVALNTLLFFGGESMDPRRLLLGFCIGPAFVSMWISNTATAVMMMPMCSGVLRKLFQPYGDEEAQTEENLRDMVRRISSKTEIDLEQSLLALEQGGALEQSTEQSRRYACGVVLGIAFSVCIGGLTTLTGTGTNLVFLAIWNSCFPQVRAVTYLQWFTFGFPLGVVMLLFCWAMLCYYYCPREAAAAISSRLNRSSLEEDLNSLGKMTFAEATVVGMFTTLVILWLTRSIGTSSGWGTLFHNYVNDGTVSVFIAMFLFIIPNRLVPGERLLSWSHCKKLPWDIVLLFGGGFSLAAGFKSSGLSAWVIQYLSFLDNAPYVLIAPVIAILVSLMTEFTSNNATATIFLPLLANAAVSNNLHPLLLMVSGTIAASFSFMLPISTPPMAIAFSTGHVKMRDMIFSGFLLKLLGILLLFALMPTLGTRVFQLEKPFLSATWNSISSTHVHST